MKSSMIDHIYKEKGMHHTFWNEVKIKDREPHKKMSKVKKAVHFSLSKKKKKYGNYTIC